MWTWIIIFGGICLFFSIIGKVVSTNNNTTSTEGVKEENKTMYQEKPIMTPTEMQFYQKIKSLEPTYKILPQVNLATIIKKVNNTKYYNDLFRNIDYAIMTNDYSKVLLLIELNDKSHQQPKRKTRDKKVEDICKNANIPFMKFYTNYANEVSYVIPRILDVIDKDRIKTNVVNNIPITNNTTSVNSGVINTNITTNNDNNGGVDNSNLS